jgi:putative aldouronate transport system permease protein
MRSSRTTTHDVAGSTPLPGALGARGNASFNATGYLFITFLSILCIVPFLLVVTGSFTENASIRIDGYRLIPKVLSLEAYKVALRYPDEVARAYGITVSLTLCGSLLGLFLTAMTAYVLVRKDFKYRNRFALYFYFTTLFSGGLVPWYILIVRYLHLKNSFLALLVPPLFSVFEIIVMRSFMKSVPEALAESVKMDGGGEFLIFSRLYLPLSKPALATIGLFIGLRYWNEWYHALFFISNKKMFPLQFYLYNILTGMEFNGRASATAGLTNQSYPMDSFKCAMTVIATGPIIILYPFLQKYFVKGLTVGAVKG